MSSPFEQLFDISPFPAVISRLRDNSVIAINKRNSEMFGVPMPTRSGRPPPTTTPTSRIANAFAGRSRRPGAPTMCCCT